MPLFRDIIGLDREKGILANSIRAGRLAHAFVFSGIDGIGKKKTALAFAQTLNCAFASGLDACGDCGDCRRFEGGAHQNLLTLVPVDKDNEPDEDGLIRVQQVREAQGFLRYRVESGKKVVLVDSAERLMPQAANAFLKTLEEPPPGSVIILVTSRLSEMPLTMLSRCQRIKFYPLPEAVIGAFLVEKKGLRPEEAALIAHLSSGSLSEALVYSIETALAKRKEAAEAFLRLKSGGMLEALRLAEELSKKDDLGETLEFLKTLLRDRALCSSGAPGLALGSDVAHLLREGDEGASPASSRRLARRLAEAFSLVELARIDITPPRYANRLLTLETLLMGLVERRVFD